MCVCNSLKYYNDTSILMYLVVAVFSGGLLAFITRSVFYAGVVCVPVVLALGGYVGNSFAMAYLLDATVGLPLLFQTLPNQFGKKRSINSLACHSLIFLLLGRAFLAAHYLELGIFRQYAGPWDYPEVFRSKDVFARVARSIGFLLHLLQAGFYAKFLLHYIPAFFTVTANFKIKDVGCELQINNEHLFGLEPKQGTKND